MKSRWQKLKSTYAYQSEWMSVRHDEVIRPDGNKGTYDVIEAGHSVAVVAIYQNRYYLVEQFRYPIGKKSLEFVQGKINQDEKPEDAARRELREETGLEAKYLEQIGFFYLANGKMTNEYYVYLAKECTMGSDSKDGTESDLQVKTLTFEDVLDKIRDGEIKDSPTISTFCLYSLMK